MTPELPTAHVTPDGVFIGDVQLPGLIAEDGIHAHVEFGGVNTLTISFVVGRIEFDGENAYTTVGGSKSL